MTYRQYDRSIEEHWTSRSIELSIERARELKKLRSNLESFREIWEELSTINREMQSLSNELKLTREDVHYLRRQLNTVAQRIGLEPLRENFTEKK